MKLVQRIRNTSIFTKIAVLTIALILVSSVVSTTYQLNYFAENIKSKERLLIREAAQRIVDFVHAKYNMVYNQRTLLHSTGYIANTIQITRDHPSDIYKPEHLQEITDYLVALCYSDDAIEEAILFTEDGENAFSYSNAAGRKVYLGYDYIHLPNIEAFYASEHPITAYYDPAPPYISLSSKADAPVISFVGKLYDMSAPAKKIVIGYLMINFSLDSIDKTYSEIDAASNGRYLLINRDNQILYSNHPQDLGEIYNDNYFVSHDVFFRKTISLSGLRVLSAVSDDVLTQNLKGMFISSINITAMTMLCMAILIVILHRHYRRRFNQLDSAMVQISQGDFSIKLPVQSRDEIGNLSQRFNAMSETLDTYIKKTYMAETQRRTAELYALQAQINPHFLTNTIESIRMRAVEDDNYEVAEMLANLGNLFRWMVQFNEDIVYLDDEVEYTKSYLELQEFRFGERVDIHLCAPVEYLYLGIPKFTIQPIVENALTHGGSRAEQPLRLEIGFAQADDALILTVTDNGRGMDEETLAALKRHISGEQAQAPFGVALRNVHKRMQLLFGEGFGLGISSVLHEGTTVTVRFPALSKKEMEHYVQDAYRR